FISWWRENRFTSGFQLRTARNANTTTISRCHHRGGLPAGPAAAGPAPPPNPSQLQPGKGPPTTQRRKASLIAEKAIKMVSQFSHAEFQVTTRARWLAV